MKVSELEGAELDYWVAKALGWTPDPDMSPESYTEGYWHGTSDFYAKYEWKPSTNWNQGGPLIEKFYICLDYDFCGTWIAAIPEKPNKYGPTPLIAAMRALVASKFGEEVE